MNARLCLIAHNISLMERDLQIWPISDFAQTSRYTLLLLMVFPANTPPCHLSQPSLSIVLFFFSIASYSLPGRNLGKLAKTCIGFELWWGFFGRLININRGQDSPTNRTTPTRRSRCYNQCQSHTKDVSAPVVANAVEGDSWRFPRVQKVLQTTKVCNESSNNSSWN